MRDANCIILLFLFILCVLAEYPCQVWADYPWIRYFERPDMPELHFAFAGSGGDVLVSTGDWQDQYFDPSRGWVESYWSEGMFRIDEDAFTPIQCPENTFVIDAAIDSHGTVWLLIAEGVDGYVEDSRRACAPPGESSLCRTPNIGYRKSIIYSRNRRFAYCDGNRVIGNPDLTAVVPDNPVSLCSDRDGRFYVFSWRWSENTSTKDRRSFVSWWDGICADDVTICEISNIFPGANMNYVAGRYPAIGPDGLAYFLVGNAWDYPASTEYAVLCLDPNTNHWEIYNGEDSPLLDSAIHYFGVDQMNIKWFGTEAGLVRFDGSNWARFTTENSGLPYSIVRQIEYDEIDGVYYVVTQEHSGSYQHTAFSIISLNGMCVGGPIWFTGDYYAWSLPKIYKDARDTWWLVWPSHNNNSSQVYGYDHKEIYHWDSSEWLSAEYSYIRYIGSDSQGRTFCAGPQCVMIW